MNPLRICYGDLAKLQTLTDSGEASGYPGTNAVDIRLSRYWRTTAAATQWIKFDAGVGKTIVFDSALILGHNLTSAAVVKIQTDDTDTWAPPGGIEKAGDPTKAIIFMDNAGLPTARRYARFYIDDPTNPAGYVQIGRVFLCVRYEGLEQIAEGFAHGLDDTTVASRSMTGQVYADLGVISRVYDLSMGHMGDVTKQSLLAICQAVGQWDPVIVFPAESATMATSTTAGGSTVGGIDPIYATMKKATRFTNAGGWVWQDDGFQFIEAH
jgi:hypothetical protein